MSYSCYFLKYARTDFILVFSFINEVIKLKNEFLSGYFNLRK